MAASILSSHSHPIHSLLRSSSLSSFFFIPSPTSSSAAAVVSLSSPFFIKSKPHRSIFFNPQFPRRFHPLSHSLSVSFSSTISNSEQEEEDEEDDDEDNEVEEFDESDNEDEIDDLGVGEREIEREIVGDGSENGVLSSSPVNRSGEVPKLTVKEKKELASYAHSLGKKLKSQLVGKSGVTSNLATSFIETLEANELLKIKIHRTCPGELEDAVRQLEELTGSVVVSQIGRTVIIYRPSITKMKAEEKRRQVRRIYAKKEPDRLKSILQNKVQISTISNRGRRGSSRF